MARHSSRDADLPWTGLLLAVVGVGCGVSVVGCSPGRVGPVVGYTATLRAANGVPGQPGVFRLLVRVRNVNGGPVPLPPLPSISEAPPRGLLPTYTIRRVSGFNQPFCDLAVQGKLSGPVAGPTTLVVDLEQSREVPWLRRLLSTGSTQPYSEVGARSRLGTFVLKPIAASAALRKR
jgi:hypothetical protein